MALSQVPKVPKVPNVNLTKYVNLGENQWRFCPVIIAGNGRIKPDYVFAAGQAELHREGSYYIEWYENWSPPPAFSRKKRDRSPCPTATPHPVAPK